MLLVGPGTVVTFGENGRVIKDGGVLIDGDTINSVGLYADLDGPEHEKLDAKGRLIMPGIINAHMHFYSTLARGITLKDPPAKNFVEVLERLWWRLDKSLRRQDCYLSAAVPILSGLRYGITTYIDHHASPFFRDESPVGCLDEISQAFVDLGVRGCLCYEASDRDGEAIALAGISESERFIEMCRTGHGDGRLSGMIGLHAQFTCSDETLEEAARVNEYLKAGFHVHCAEDASDTKDAQKRGFKGAVDRLREFGILGDRSILAHCIHISDEEADMVAESGSAVVHQPTSNMNNGVGAADVVGLKARGIPMGVGTDGMSANVFDDFRTSSWLMRHRSSDPSQGWGESFELLYKGNPAIASRYFEKPVGTLEEGSYADVAVMDYIAPTPLNNDNFAGHLLFGVSHSTALHTICHGKVLLKDAKLNFDLDEEALMANARERAAALWERF